MEFWKRTLNLVPGRPASAPNQLRSSSPSLLSVVPLGCATLQATFTKRNTQMEPSGRVASMGPIGTSRSVAASTSPSRRWRMQFGQGAYLELHANPHDAALEDQDEDEAPCEHLQSATRMQFREGTCGEVAARGDCALGARSSVTLESFTGVIAPSAQWDSRRYRGGSSRRSRSFLCAFV